MPNYRVEFAIDVAEPDPAAACRRAWSLLTSPDAMLPVGTVTNEAGDTENIDLQELAESAEE